MAVDDAEKLTGTNEATAEQLFAGNWISLKLSGTERVQAAIKNGTLPSVNYSVEEGLPFPLTELAIDASQSEIGPIEDLHARIEFDMNLMPEYTMSEQSEDWKQAIVNEVLMNTTQNISKHRPHAIAHEKGVAYIQVDDVHTLRIEATSELSRCIVWVHLVNTDDVLRFQGHEPVEDAGGRPDFDSYLVLQTALEAITHATNQVMEWSKMGATIQPQTHELNIFEAEDASKYVQFLAPDEQNAFTPEKALRQIPNDAFDSIGGARAAKIRLNEIGLTVLNPELAQDYDISGNNYFILLGPGGTGKTTLIKSFAKGIGGKLMQFSSADITESLVGQSGRNMKAVFEKVKSAAEGNGPDVPIVLFLDEFDSLAPKGSSGTSERVDVKNIIKDELSSLSLSYPSVVVAAASNREPQSFDEELLRAGRIEQIYVPKPDDQEMVEVWHAVWSHSLSRFVTAGEFQGKRPVIDPYDVPLLDFESLAKQTSGLVGADINKILLNARTSKFMAAVANGGRPKVTQRDIEEAVRTYKRPV